MYTWAWQCHVCKPVLHTYGQAGKCYTVVGLVTADLLVICTLEGPLRIDLDGSSQLHLYGMTDIALYHGKSRPLHAPWCLLNCTQ